MYIHISTGMYYSRMTNSHCYWHLEVMNGNFTIATRHLLFMNGYLTVLLTSSGKEWQFYNTINMYWSRMVISYCWWHVVVNNGNFTLPPTFTLVKNGNFTIATDINWSGMDIFTFLTGLNYSRMSNSHCY